MSGQAKKDFLTVLEDNRQKGETAAENAGSFWSKWDGTGGLSTADRTASESKFWQSLEGQRKSRPAAGQETTQASATQTPAAGGNWADKLMGAAMQAARNRLGYVSGSSDTVNDTVTDYRVQRETYQNSRDNIRDAQQNIARWERERDQLIDENRWTAPGAKKAENQKEIERLNRLIAFAGTEAPERPLLDAREYANRTDPSGSAKNRKAQRTTELARSETAQQRAQRNGALLEQARSQELNGSSERGQRQRMMAQAGSIKSQMRQVRREEEQIQKRYQPDSRDYQEGMARAEARYNELQKRYEEVPKTELPQGTAAQERQAAQEEWDAALEEIDRASQRLYAADDDEFDAAVAAYKEAESRVAAAEQRLRQAERAEKAAPAEKSEEEQQVDALREKLLRLQQEQTGLDRGLGVTQEQKQQKAQEIAQTQEELRQAEAQVAQKEAEARLAERDATLNSYEEEYRHRPDFGKVTAETKEKSLNSEENNPKGILSGFQKPGDKLGYYLANQETLDAGADSESPYSRWHWLSDNEIDMYYYLLGAKGEETAYQYLDDLTIRLDKRISDYTEDQQQINYATASTAGKVGMNLLTPVASVAGSISSGAVDAFGMVTGQYNPYSSAHGVTNYTTTVRGATAREIANSIEDPFWSQLAANSYQAVMSAADSALGATLFGNGYTAMMGSTAASQKARELYESGASNAQIGLGAVASGLIEVASEKYSIEYFTENFLRGDINGFKDWAKKTLIMSLNEGSEEVASEIANIMADAVIQGGNSDNSREIAEMMNAGMSYDEAKRQAFVNRATDVFWAYYGGALSGGVMGGIGGAINGVQQDRSNRAAGRQIIENQNGEALLQAADSSGTEGKLRAAAEAKAQVTVQQYQEMTAREQRETERAMGRLYSQVTEQQAQTTEQEIRQDFAQEAEKELAGKTENPAQAAEIVAKEAFGEKLTRQEQKIADAVGSTAVIEKVQNSQNFQEAAGQRLQTLEQTLALTDSAENPASPTALREARQAVETAAREYEDPGQMTSLYKAGQDPTQYTAGWRAAYDNGSIGLDVRYSLNSRQTRGMTQEQILAAHEAGRKAAGYEQAEGNVQTSEKWNDVRRPGRQIAAVAEGTAAAGTAGQEIRAGAGAAAAAQGKVSARGLGIANGTTEENLTVRPAASYTADEKAAARVAQAHGLDITIVQGGSIKTAQEVDGRKVLVKARALIEGNKIIVRSDDPTFTAEQIARHEAAHRQIETGEINLGSAVKQLQQTYSPDRLREIIRLYAAAYGNSGMNARQVLEEIVCDAMGEMNAFATDETASVAGEVGRFLRDVNRAAQGKPADAETYNESGKQVPPGGKLNEQKSNLKHSRETDAEYMKLAADPEENGAELREMVEAAAEEAGFEYRRNTRRKHAPANAVPWQMFVRDVGIGLHAYGEHYYYATAENAIQIEDIMPKLRELANEYYGETIADNEINPPDIVDSAGVWDDMEFVQYMWDNYFADVYDETGEMPAIVTDDGMLVMGEDNTRVKSGEVVEYDDEGNIIPLSKRFDAAQDDIRYSREMDTIAALKRQNEILQQRIDYWRSQTEVTKGVLGADKMQVKALARKLLRDYGSRTRTAEIAPMLQQLADAMQQGKNEVKFESLKDMAENIAGTVLEGTEIDVNADQKETAKELKRMLRNRYINVDEGIKEDIGDFADWKKRNRALHFKEEGKGVSADSLWLELQDEFGKGLFPESVTNPADKIRHIADTVARMQEELWQNPYSAEMELTVQQMANDILNEVQKIDRAKGTKADQAVRNKQKELDALEENVQMREAKAAAKADTALRNKQKELDALIERGKMREAIRTEEHQKAVYRQRIRNLNEKFQKMAVKPGKGVTQHAPRELVKATRDFCELFNDSEQRRADRWGKTLEQRADKLGRRMSTPNVTETMVEEYGRIESAQARMERMKARVSDLQAEYARMENGEETIAYDENVKGMIDRMAGTLRGKDIYQLSANDLQTVAETMSAMMYTVTNANKAFSLGKDKEIIDTAKKWADEMRQVGYQAPGLKALAGRYAMWQMTPDTFFNYTCGYIKDNEGQTIQKAFKRGEEKMLGVQREFYEMMQDITESGDAATRKELSKLMNGHGKKDMVSYGLKDSAGNDVATTRGMMMQVYMMLQQRASRESLQTGGFSIPNMDAYYKGDYRGAYGNAEESAMFTQAIGKSYGELAHQQQKNMDRMRDITALLQEGTADAETAEALQAEAKQLERDTRGIRAEMKEIVEAAEKRLEGIEENIEKMLTPLERQLIDRAHEWYSHTGDLMSEVYTQMYGFQPRLVEGYVPIHRDPASIKIDIRTMEDAGKAFNLENSGFTIERVRNSQPILLTDFFQELESQKEKMSRYVGFAQVQKDFGKIWKTRVSRNGTTINKLVEAKFGAGKTAFGVSGVDYVEHYIADVAGGHSSDDVLGNLYGNYAAATLRLNPRVAVSQAASIPTAASVVGWKSMAVGFAKGLPKAVSKDYRNELAGKNVWFWQRYRGQGGSTELADIRQKGNIIEKVANSRVGKKLFNWCQTVDVFSTGSIMWSAAEDYVQAQRGLKPGAEGYEAAVNEVYTDIIRKSQPNYTTTERSDLLRDNRAHMKMLTMFKTQSNQNLNLLMEANGEFIRMWQDFKNGRNNVTAADVKAAKAKVANAATGVFLGGTVAFVGLRTIMNFIMAAVNPYRDKDTDEVTLAGVMKGMAKEVLSSLAGTVAIGGQVYDVIMATISGDTYYGLSDSAISVIAGTIENTQKVIANALDEGKEVTPAQIWKAVNSWCTAWGIPAGNAKKVYDMVLTYVRDIQNGTFGKYTSDKTTAAQYRAQVKKYVLSGNADEADNALAMLFAKSGGDTDTEVEKDIAAGMRTYLKREYMAANITDLEAVKIMKYTGTEDAEAVLAKWNFMIEHPEIETTKVSDSLVAAYNDRGNIDEDVFLSAWEFAKAATADKDKNGKTISGSKKKKVVEYIKGLNLTNAQKKKLYELLDVGSTKDTPWG